MDLKVMSVHGQGDKTEEAVVLRVLKNCNLKGYMILDETFDAKGKVSNKHRHVYDFPDLEVKKDEYVFLMTRVGTNVRGKAKNGEPAHYFYWGLNNSVWNDSGDTVHLLKIEDAASFQIAPAL